MQVCVVYCPKGREDRKLDEVAKSFAKGIESQGHSCDVINIRTDGDRKLTFYDYIIFGTSATTTFGGRIPEEVAKYLARAGQVSGKRCLAFVTGGGLRKGKTLSSLMKAMEGEGMYLKYSEVVDKPGMALALGKRLNVERNF